MATNTKTKDYEISGYLPTGGITLNANDLKGYTAISFVDDGAGNRYGIDAGANKITGATIYTTDTTGANAGDLVISFTGTTDTLTIHDYYDVKKKKVTSPIKYFKGADTAGLALNIIDEWGNVTINGAAVIGAPTKGTKVTGTNFADSINVSGYIVPSNGKGLTINGGAGDDTITGTTGTDTILGGTGDDTIYTTAGNDVITGGAGNNTIVLTSATDNPTIVLTKGENLILDVHNVDATIGNYSYEFDKNNLLIKNNGVTVATIKNFGASDATGATGSVLLHYTATPYNSAAHNTDYIDLKNDAIFEYSDFTAKKSSYTDKWYSSTIDASSLNSEIVKNNKGATINAGAGNDIISGSGFNDTINGGDGDDKIYVGGGNDTITGGKGTNEIFLKTGASPTIVLTKGEKLIIRANTVTTGVNLSYDKNNLLIKDTATSTVIATIKNFKNSDVTGADGAVILDINGNYNIATNTGTQFIDLKNNDLSAYGIASSSADFSAKKMSFNDSYLSSVINATSLDTDATLAAKYAKVKDTQKKGATINANGGNDVITGSMYNDTINAGDGNDTINATAGIDTITGGKGTNTAVYGAGLAVAGWGTDTYNLTQGENLNLNLIAVGLSYDDLNISVSGNDIVITSNKAGTAKGSQIILKNYGKTNVTGDSGSVTLTTTSGTKNLADVYLIKDSFVGSSYTGTWHNEYIDASSYSSANGKGITINAVAGNNIITGSTSADTIKGGTGNDTIKGGKGDDNLYGVAGNNTFEFGTGDGSDKVYSGKGSDTLYFNTTTAANSLTYVREGNNLVVSGYSDNVTDKVTVVNYFSGTSSIKAIKTNAAPTAVDIANITFNAVETVAGVDVKNTANAYSVNAKTGAITITGSKLSENINGGTGDDVLKGTAGKNIIDGKAGNDSLYSGTDADTFKFAKGYGVDTIYNSINTDKIDLSTVAFTSLSFAKNGNNLEITSSSWDEDDKVVVANYFSAKDKVDKILADNSTTPTTYSIVTNVLEADILHITGKGSVKGTDYGDILEGTNGVNDTITGGKGTDKVIFRAGSGNDSIYYTEGEKLTIEWQDGSNSVSDFKFTQKGKDVVITKTGNDSDSITIKNLVNTKLSTGDIVFKTTGNVTGKVNQDLTGVTYELGDEDSEKALNITGTNLSEVIDGGKGNDTLKAVGGDDVLTGNKGNDTLYGGTGTNTFVFNENDGNDIVNLGTGSNILNFNTTNSLSFSAKGKDLVISNLSGTTEVNNVTVKNYFNLSSADVTINTVSGTTTTTVTALTVKGTEGVDNLKNPGGNVTFELGTGNDVVYGGANAGDVTTVTIKAGDGNKTIYPGYTTAGVSTNTIKFDSSVNSSNVSYDVNGNDIIITYTQGTDSTSPETVTVKDYLKGYNNAPLSTVNVDYNGAADTLFNRANNRILGAVKSGAQDKTVTAVQNITGTVFNETIYGGSGNDTLRAGAGTDTINAGAGKNTIYGGTGSNTFKFDSGSADVSNDTLHLDGSATLNLIDIDENAANVSYKASGNDLLVTYGTSTAQSTLTVKDILKSGSTAPSADVKLKDVTQTDLLTYVNTYHLADAIGDTTATTSKTLTGTVLAEKIYGGSASDTLKASGEGDILEGGKGDDKLYAGSANTTYNFAAGDGNDTIYNATSTDVINVTSTTGISGVTYSRENKNDLKITLAHTSTTEPSDSITIKDYFTTDADKRIDTINGLTGLSGAVTKLSNVKLTITGEGTLEGTDLGDKIVGGAKANVINTGNGDDDITPGSGNDVINVTGSGTKTITIKDGDGNDTINLTDKMTEIKLMFKGTDGTSASSLTTTTYETSATGKDLIINRTLGTTQSSSTTIKGYFDLTDTQKANVKVGEAAINLSTETINYTATAAGTIAGTALKDNITGSDGVDVISTGAGDDIITAGKGNDTITVNGEGTKTINVKKGDGVDTIVVSDTKAVVDLVVTDSANVTDTTYSKSGNDLIISRVYGSTAATEVTETTKVQNYFINPYNGTTGVKVKVNSGSVLDFVNGGAKLVQSVTGTAYSETINGTEGDDKITTGAGDDTIKSGKGNDTITVDGAGTKTIERAIGDGNDTVVITNGTANVNVSAAVSSVTESYEADLEGKNLTIVSKSGTGTAEVTDKLTINDYFEKSGKVTIAGYTAGTSVINVKGTTGADKISVNAGKETVYTNGGKDEVTINAIGEKTISIDRADKNTDVTIQFASTAVSAATSTTPVVSKVAFTDAGATTLTTDTTVTVNTPEYTYTKSGNDLVVNVSYAADTKTTTVSTVTTTTVVREATEHTVTVKDYFNTAVVTGTTVKAEFTNDAQQSISAKGININTAETEGENKGKFVGRDDAVKDIITGTDSADVLVKTGAGDDVINMGKGNDSITIDGAGNKVVQFARGDGNDTISGIGSSDSTTITYTTKGAKGNQVFEKSGNDLVITTNYEADGSLNPTATTDKVTVKDFFTTTGVADKTQIKFGDSAAQNVSGAEGYLQGKLTVAAASTTLTTVTYSTDTTYGSVVNANSDKKNVVTLSSADKTDTVNADINKVVEITQNGTTASSDVVNITGSTDISSLSFVVDVVATGSTVDASNDVYYLNGAQANYGSTGITLNNYTGSTESTYKSIQFQGKDIIFTSQLMTDMTQALQTKIAEINSTITTEDTYTTAYGVLDGDNESHKQQLLAVYDNFKGNTKGDDTYNLTGGKTVYFETGAGNDIVNLSGTAVNTLVFDSAVDFSTESVKIEKVGANFADVKITYGTDSVIIKNVSLASNIQITGNKLFKGYSDGESAQYETGVTTKLLSDIIGILKTDVVYQAADISNIEESKVTDAKVDKIVLNFDSAKSDSTLSYEKVNNNLLVTNTVKDGEGNVVSTKTITVNSFFGEHFVDFKDKLYITYKGANHVPADVIDTLLTSADLVLTSGAVTKYNDIFTATANITESTGNNEITTAGGITINGGSGDDTYIVTDVTKKTVINDAAGEDTLQINGAKNKDLYYVFNVAKEDFAATRTYALDGGLYVTSDSDFTKLTNSSSVKGVQIGNYIAGWVAKTESTDATTTTTTGITEHIKLADADGKNIVDTKVDSDILTAIHDAVQIKLLAANSNDDIPATYNTAFDLLNATAGSNWTDAQKTALADAKTAVINAYKQYRIGSDAADTFKADVLDQHFYAGKGSDVFEFTATSTGTSEITSATAKGEVDTLKITGADEVTYSSNTIWSLDVDNKPTALADSALTFTLSTDVVTSTGTTPVTEKINYKLDTTDNITSVVMNDVTNSTSKTITVLKATDDYTFEAAKGDNDAYIQQATTGKKVNIVSNKEGTNKYEVLGNSGGNTFEYNGADDTYVSYGNSNDTYDIKVTSFNSKLDITDNGSGDADVLNFLNIDYKDLRYFFKVNFTQSGSTITGATLDDESSLKIVTSDSLGGLTAVRGIVGGNYKGVGINGTSVIDTVKAKNGDGAIEVNSTAYITSIVSQISAWAVANSDDIISSGITNSDDLFKSNSGTLLASGLVDIYNTAYTAS